jgi:hypothetical protein
MNEIFLLRGIMICAFRGYQKNHPNNHGQHFLFTAKKSTKPKIKRWMARNIANISVTLPHSRVYCYDMHE